MLEATLPQKTCKGCGKPFQPFRSMQVVCRWQCASKMVRKEKKAERTETKKRKEAVKKISTLIAEAQVAFNNFVRARDRIAGHPCISSGRPLVWTGNQTDAGHYRSTGAASHLRFNEDNCHAQSKADNLYLSGNAVDYRINLIHRIGLERVQALENDNAIHKWTREELVQIKETYRQKLKDLQKLQ